MGLQLAVYEPRDRLQSPRADDDSEPMYDLWHKSTNTPDIVWPSLMADGRLCGMESESASDTDLVLSSQDHRHVRFTIFNLHTAIVPPDIPEHDAGRILDVSCSSDTSSLGRWKHAVLF